jgi:hypothetical protein
LEVAVRHRRDGWVHGMGASSGRRTTDARRRHIETQFRGGWRRPRHPRNGLGGGVLEHDVVENGGVLATGTTAASYNKVHGRAATWSRATAGPCTQCVATVRCRQGGSAAMVTGGGGGCVAS